MATLGKLLITSLLMGSLISNADKLLALQQQTTPALPADSSKDPAAPSNPTPRPNPDASGKYHVGDGVTAPKLIRSSEPKFSRKSRNMKTEGDCLVALIVSTNGVPTSVHVIKSFADSVDEKLREAALSLDENSVKAVEQYRFEPATYQGEPVPVELRVKIHFSLY
ncbi:energy transducer TonB [Tunturiibacter gelidiferens]|uniref:energy transducer TonB n=1 Tax=Tunturiibacter gelidiferens TaxID=3069689 RepID=UPI003D9BBC2D